VREGPFLVRVEHFPHPTCLYPNVREHVDASLEGISEAEKRMVLYENAARVYQLPSPL